MMAGATEKIIIQIASLLNVNLSSFMFSLPLLALPNGRALSRAHVPWFFLTIVIIR
jgi:hypothetical protein